MGLAEAWPTLANKRQRETRKQACAPRMVFEFQIYQRHEEQYGSTRTHTHTHMTGHGTTRRRPPGARAAMAGPGAAGAVRILDLRVCISTHTLSN